ncbi:MAG: hypothetical protein J6V96_00445 [Aeriscardovia sp.]|nr:hypothetical protein [Aeriscardovia sp.]
MEKLFTGLTDGSELGIDTPGIQIAHTVCDYCGKEVIGVWDDHIKSSRGLPYQGWVARTPRSGSKNNRYPYKARTIAEIKDHYGIGEKEWFTEENNLLNVCGKVHILVFKGGKWNLRTDLSYESPAATRILCNNCFEKANNCRVAIMGTDGLMYSVSAMADKGETIEENDGKVTVKLWGYDKPLQMEGAVIGARIAPFNIALGGWKVSASGKITGVPDLKWEAEEHLFSCRYSGTFGLSGEIREYEACARVTENMDEFKEEFKQHCEEKDYMILRKEAISEQTLKELESLK